MPGAGRRLEHAAVTRKARRANRHVTGTAKQNVFLEVIRNRFQGIVDEMGSVVLRTGHTVFVKETGDFGTALVTTEGELFAAPLNYGVCILAGMPAQTSLAAIRDEVEPGAIFAANDPYSTGGMSTHLNDIFLWKPVFAGSALVCYCWSFIHSTDVGGGVPGSISYSHREIFQEGLVIPPTRVGTRDGWDERVLRLVLANSRIPDLNRGDLNALLAALNVGERRILDLVDRYGVEAIRNGMKGVLEYAARQAELMIRSIPEGTFHFSDYLDEDAPNGHPIRIDLALTVRDGRVLLDYTGTDPQADSSINMPTEGSNAHHFLVRGLVNYFRSQDPAAVPYQSGLLRQVETRVARGSLLAPYPGTACGVRAATNIRLMETILGALAQALPDKIPAAGAGQAAVFLVAVADEQHAGSLRVSVVEPLCGGSGGRPDKDGVDGTDSLTGGLRNIPIETLESEMPILIERYGLLPGSAGSGRYRGGHGVDIVFRILSPRATVTGRNLDRYRFRPWGRDGGAPGSLGDGWIIRAGERRERVGRLDVVRLSEGEAVQLHSQGGGGFGDALDREPQAVLVDVENGLLDPSHALATYGVIVRGRTVDMEATFSERASRARANASVGRFSFGPEREDHERRYPPKIRAALVTALQSLPFSRRREAWNRAMTAIGDRARDGRPVSVEDVPALLDGSPSARKGTT